MPEDPIAIVGASCRLPGAATIEDFWSLLIDGRDAIADVPETRWATRHYYHPRLAEPGKSYTWRAGLLSGIDLFDAEFFSLSAREARQIDPQQRLLLELAWEALEDSGLTARSLKASGAGVYIGASATEYANLRWGDPASADPHFMLGNTLSIFANRISYLLDLRGPSFVVDTACSSSLVALHLACEDLRRGRTDCAFVGGVNMTLSPFPFVGFSRAGMLSRAGRCFAFDARADGYVRGEGGVMLLLRPLAAAIADGDDIRGTILATGTNSDGRTPGLSFPSQTAQAALLARLYTDAGIAPDRLGFVEAHGTGTSVGDPIEAAALGEVLGQARRTPLPIGSVKTNIGHLEPASGLAGLLKAMLALEHRVLPPSLNYEAPNPEIDFDRLNLGVASDAVILPNEAHGSDLVAGVNSFGFGGANAHAILAPAPIPQPPEGDSGIDGCPPLLLSARSDAALRELAGNWRAVLASAEDETGPDAAALIRGAARRRDHHAFRLAVPGGTAAAIATALDGYCDGRSSAPVATGKAVAEGRLAFVFSGNGAQWLGMGRDALSHNLAFREQIDELDAVLAPALGWSVTTRLVDGLEADAMARTDVAQPLLFAIQVGIVSALRRLGLTPDACVGHSFGEIAAAWTAGALTLDDAARVVVARSRHQQTTRGRGRMAVLGASETRAKQLAARIGLAKSVEVAAVNARESVTIVGPESALARLAGVAAQEALAFTPLDLDYPFHSAAMDNLRDGLIADLAGIVPRQPDLLMVSTVTAEPVEDGTLDADYWWRNVRAPVRFADALVTLVERARVRLFLEIGAKPILLSYLYDALGGTQVSGRVLATLGTERTDTDPFPQMGLACHVAGADLSRSACYDQPARGRALPRTPWQRQSHWFEQTQEGVPVAKPTGRHPLLGVRRFPDVAEWTSHLDLTLHPWLGDHRIEREAVLPAAAIIDIALAAADESFAGAAGLEIADLELQRPITLSEDRIRELRLRCQPSGLFDLAARPRLAGEEWAVHAAGRLTGLTDPMATDVPRLAADTIIGADRLYEAAEAAGFCYGPAFRRAAEVELHGADAATVRLRASGAEDPNQPFLVDPCSLDAAFHGVIGLMASRAGRLRGILVPWRFGRVVLHRRRQTTSAAEAARVHIRAVTDHGVLADITLLDGSFTPFLVLEECWFRELRARARVETGRILYRTTVPAPLGAAPPSDFCLARARAAMTAIASEAVADPDTSPLLHAFIAASCRDAAASLGPHDAGLGLDALAAHAAMAPETIPLLERLSANLEAADELPAATEIWRALFFGARGLAAANTLVLRAAERLPEALRCGPLAAEAAGLGEQLLQGPPLGTAVATSLAAAVLEVARAWPSDRPLRVLEFGAGRGVLSRRILRSLRGAPASILYTAATDPARVAALRASLLPFGNATAEAWNPAATQRFDIVIAAHALGDAVGAPGQPEELASLRNCLVRDGLLLAVELAPDPLWDLLAIAGLLERGTRSAGDWTGALAAAGYACAGADEIAAPPWALLVLTAQAPGEAPAATVGVLSGPTLVVADDEDKLADALCRGLAASGPVRRAARCEKVAGETVVVLPRPRLSADARIALDAEAARQAQAGNGRLVLVTRDAGTDPVEAARRAIGRVIANEMPGVACRRLDLGGDLEAVRAAACLCGDLAADDAEAEAEWAGHDGIPVRRAPRVSIGFPPSITHDEQRQPVRLGAEVPGLIQTLRWEAAASPAPGPDEVAIGVQACGLNFRDLMWAMRLLPDEAVLYGFAGPTLGMECAGIVESVGRGVTGFSPGDRVMAVAPGAFATRIVTASHAIAHLPDGASFADGATIPVAFLSAVYGLGHLARLRRDETVLIHAGTGGVGLAAIQYALHRGARVVATAGSPAKRAVLRALGLDAVLDSRSLRFADEVRALTDGNGVDVLLNSLSDEAMERSLGLLAPFGRFVELGKRDIYAGRRIGLRPLRRNASYFAVDADELLAGRPDVVREVLAEIAALFASGALRPLPRVQFPYSEAVDAFALFRTAEHVGKIVLVPDHVAAEAPREAPSPRRDRTWVVTGGTSGFGARAALSLAASGVCHLALLSRRGPSAPEADALRQRLEAAGAQVDCFACDVADGTELAATLDMIRAAMPPIGGVVHAAQAGGDGLLETLDAETVAAALRPKLAGAEALDRLTRTDPVETFLLFSSATTMLGSPGQGAYVAANAALEALAARRRDEGLPALAVAWGLIADAGMLAAQPTVGAALARRLKAVPMPSDQALGALSSLLGSGEPVLAYAEVNWGDGRTALPILAEPMFGRLWGWAETGADNDNLRARLVGLSAAEAEAVVAALVQEQIAATLQISRDRIDIDRPLSELGMDSLMGVELKIALERQLGEALPGLTWGGTATPRKLAARLVATLAGAVAAAERTAVTGRHFDEDDPERLRLERLADEIGTPSGPVPADEVR